MVCEIQNFIREHKKLLLIIVTHIRFPNSGFMVNFIFCDFSGTSFGKLVTVFASI